tara:strand:- start:187 stop:1053 length:867 start_codon:yes stop_codon:yes gene_type:complete
MSQDKIALVIEGGGFKSVFSAGVLDAFLVNNFNPFHIYIGVSSGAMSLSYYLSNKYKAYLNLSNQVCVNDQFLSYKHALSEEGYMNLKYLTSYAIKNNPLDLVQIKSVIKNKYFSVVATNTDNGEAVFLDPIKNNIYKCLRATSSLPFFTKGLCKINGLNLMDGAWSDPIPVRSAIKQGANRVVVIRPHPFGYKLDGLNYLGLIAGYWWRNNPQISNKFFEEYDHYNKAVDFLTQNDTGVEIIQICPRKILKSTVLGTDQTDLLEDYCCGLEKGLDFINNYMNHNHNF